MVVLTDILVAPVHDTPAIISEWPGVKRWPAIEATGLDGLVLKDLAAALGILGWQKLFKISIHPPSPMRRMGRGSTSFPRSHASNSPSFCHKISHEFRRRGQRVKRLAKGAYTRDC